MLTFGVADRPEQFMCERANDSRVHEGKAFLEDGQLRGLPRFEAKSWRRVC